MFVISNLLNTIARILNMIFGLYEMILVARIVISWVSPSPFNPIVQFLYRATEPLLDPIRRNLPPMGMIDFSPMLLFILIHFLLRGFLVQTLLDIAYQIR